MKYRPSNGTEGEIFMARFCDRCAKDVGQACPIVLASLVFEIDAPEYPPEWVTDDAGARCTAFEAAS